MEITVLVEQVTGNGFRAVSGEPLHLEADAPTRDEAVNKLQGLIAHRLQTGVEVVRLTFPDATNPLAPFAGMLKDDPLLQPWKDAMQANRQQREHDRNSP